MPNKKRTNDASREKSYKQAAIILVVLFVMVVVGVLVYSVASVGTARFYRETIPKISASVTAADGTAHSVEAEFTIEVGGEALSTTERKTLNTLISSIIADTSYETINSKGGPDKLKGEIKERLGERYPDLSIEDISITQLAIDRPITDPNNSTGKEPSDAMKGLFKKVR